MTEVIVSTLCFSELKQRILNDKLMQLEKGFTFPNGIPGLPQIRLVDHSIGAVCSSNTSISFQRIKTLIAHLTEGAKATLKTIFFEEYGQKQQVLFVISNRMLWLQTLFYIGNTRLKLAKKSNKSQGEHSIIMLSPVIIIIHHLPSCSHCFNFGGSLHPLERSKLNVQNLNSTPCPPTTTTFTPTPQKTVKSVILWFYSQLSSAPVNTTKKCQNTNSVNY